jgi:hypothetical protein
VKDHLPRHQLEKLVADDPHAPIHPALWVHVASCDHCTTRKRALEAVRARYLMEYPAANFAQLVLARAAQPEPTPRRTSNALRVVLIATLLLIAPALGVFWFVSNSQPMPLHTAGGVGFEVFVKRAGTTLPVSDGAHLASLDRLTFAYALDRARYLLLLGIDEHGTVTRYFPADDAPATVLSASPRRQLPIHGEFVVQQPGDQRLFALFSDVALDEDEARGTLARALSAARGRGVGISGLGRVDLPAQQISVWFRTP